MSWEPVGKEVQLDATIQGRLNEIHRNIELEQKCSEDRIGIEELGNGIYTAIIKWKKTLQSLVHFKSNILLIRNISSIPSTVVHERLIVA